MQNLSSFILLCSLVLVIGYCLSWLLYRIKHMAFTGSTLQTKVLMWLPIFAVVLLFAYGNIVVHIGIACWIIYELWREALSRSRQLSTLLYTSVVSLGICAAVLIAQNDHWLLLSVWFMSVLSDVTAFFFGNFSGKFHLPSWLNKHKSWDGVLGQVVGGLFGLALLRWQGADISWQFGLLVGAGAATGDLTNSYIKRRLSIKDWSKRIPGHGGYLDRLCSLAIALLLAGIYQLAV